MTKVKFKIGTKEQYDALLTKDENAIYWLTNTKEIYKGSTLYGKGQEATKRVAGLLSSEDKAKLDAMSVAGGLTATDASLVVETLGALSGAKVNISVDGGNAIILKENGLFVKDLSGAVSELSDALTWIEI